MIEQTELVINKWAYSMPVAQPEEGEYYFDLTYLDVMRKSTPEKKGIACRFTCRVSLKEQTILDYVAQDSYVIDPDDVIDKAELLSMIRNAYTKFVEKFDLKKLGTVLQNISLRPLDESEMNLDDVLLRLQL